MLLFLAGGIDEWSVCFAPLRANPKGVFPSFRTLKTFNVYWRSTTCTVSFLFIPSIFTYIYVSRRNNTLAHLTRTHTHAQGGNWRVEKLTVLLPSALFWWCRVFASLSSTCVSEFRFAYALWFPLSCVSLILFTLGGFAFYRVFVYELRVSMWSVVFFKCSLVSTILCFFLSSPSFLIVSLRWHTFALLFCW